MKITSTAGERQQSGQFNIPGVVPHFPLNLIVERANYGKAHENQLLICVQKTKRATN